MRHITKLLAGVGLAVGGSLGGFGASIAAAAPSNSPTALQGTFTCQGGETGTFVVNSGNAMTTTWTVAHLAFAGGSTGIFVPTSVNLTLTLPPSPPMHEIATKGNGNPPADETCTINAPVGPGMLTGTVTGRIVMNG